MTERQSPNSTTPNVDRERLQDLEGISAAVNRAQAVIEFDVTGKVLDANRNFLETMGYTLDEIVGKHHRIFCDVEFAKGNEYRDFWVRLGEGEYESGEFRRFADCVPARGVTACNPC